MLIIKKSKTPSGQAAHSTVLNLDSLHRMI